MESQKSSFGQIFNHNILDCSSNDSLDKVVGVLHYGGRVLGSTKQGDVIQLHPDLYKHWDWIRNHYKNAGISYTNEVVWDEDFYVMNDFPNHQPDVFFFGNRANVVRPDKSWFSIVQKMNSKNHFIETCRMMGIPVPETQLYGCKSEITNLERFDFPLYLKLAVSVSGLGVWRCENVHDLQKYIENISKGVPLQVQQAISATSFLNIQYKVNGKLERILVTEQVLKGNCHAGNSYPAHNEPWIITDPLARCMADNGMKGVFAFDVGVCQLDDGSSKYWAIECNPRYNGSSYPTEIAKKIGAKNWIAKKVKTNVDNFSGVDLGGLTFSPKTGKGVVIVNWGSISENEVSALFIASTEKERNLLEEDLSKIM